MLAIAFMGWHGQRYWQATQQVMTLPLELTLSVLSVQPSHSGRHKVMAQSAVLTSEHRIKLSWPATLPIPRGGESWQIQTRLKPPHDYGNPASFNYRRYLLSQHIVATGYVRQAKRLSLPPMSFKLQLQQAMSRWQAPILQQLESYHSAALLQAMTLGVREGMTAAHWQVLAQTGTSHLMAISGLHLGICFSCFLFLLQQFRRLMLYLGVWQEQLPAWWPYGVAALLSTGYAFSSGLALPTLRALLFVWVYCLTKRLRIQLNHWHVFASVAVVLLLLSPQQAYSSSFWLSFTAVGCVLTGLSLAQGWKIKGWRRLVLIQITLSFGMLPLQAGLFGLQSLLAPLINFVVIPWLGLTILPVALLGVGLFHLWPELSQHLLWLADLQLNALYSGLEWLSDCAWQLIYPDLSVALSLLMAGLLLLYSHLLLYRSLYYGTALLALILIGQWFRHFQTFFSVTLLDVGQGQALVIRHSFETLLYDVGPAYSSDFNAATTVVNPYLHQQGITRLSAIVISHRDNDHAGALPFLATEIERELLFRPIASKGGRACERGVYWRAHPLSVEFLSTPIEGRSSNDNSCVVRVSSGEHRALLTGDISAQIEAELIAQQPARLGAELLLLAHHGSRTSSSLEFIQAVDPKVALVSAGYRNRWQFPSQPVVNRLQQQGIPLLSTAELGQIKIQYQQGQWRWQGDCQLRWPCWYRCQ